MKTICSMICTSPALLVLALLVLASPALAVPGGTHSSSSYYYYDTRPYSNTGNADPNYYYNTPVYQQKQPQSQQPNPQKAQALPKPLSATELENDAGFQACVEFHEQFLMAKSDSKDLCAKDSNRRYKSLEPEFKACTDAVKLITASLGSDATLGLMCYHLPRDFNLASPQNQKCVTKAAATVAPYFWFYEDGHIRKSGFENSVPGQWVQNCATKSNAPASKNAKVRLYSRTVFHSLTPVEDGSHLLGGLSGMSWDDKNQLIVVSDDRTTPSLNVFRLTTRRSLYPLQLEFRRSIPVGSSITDMEDIVIDKNGEYIISSEEIPGRSFKSEANSGPIPQSYVFQVSKDGHFVADLDLPKELYSSTLELDAQCSTNGDGFGGLFSALGRLFSGRPKPPSSCKNYHQTNGIQYNKGLEGMALSPDKNYLYFGPEQPLMGATNGPNSEIPLYVRAMDNSETVTYKYPIDTTMENGLVAILSLSQFQILTMERAYNPDTKEGVVQIFKVDLNPRRTNEILAKKLLFNLQDLREQMAVGFEKIDNFEGIAPGPRLPNGNASIIIVSDNNLSTKQRTDFMVLELSKDLLK